MKCLRNSCFAELCWARMVSEHEYSAYFEQNGFLEEGGRKSE